MIMEIYADYNKEDKKLLGKYISPNSENSTFKGIPMSLYGKVTSLLPMKDRRIKFRGPSTATYTRPQSHMIKEFADTFAVYYDNKTILHLGRPGE
tara:strand:+ start:143 stop:427 length:285 start_codon:yes stop_codon:yes gene_type:complete